MKLSKQERMLLLVGLSLVAGIVFLVSMSCFIHTVSHWGGERKERKQGHDPELRHTTKQTPRPTWTPVPVQRIVVTPTSIVKSTPTVDVGIQKVLEMLEGCGGLSKYEMQKIYWSVVVAQDKAVELAEEQNTRPDYALADLAVMAYFSITAGTLECIGKKGDKEMWPIPSTP